MSIRSMLVLAVFACACVRAETPGPKERDGGASAAGEADAPAARPENRAPDDPPRAPDEATPDAAAPTADDEQPSRPDGSTLEASSLPVPQTKPVPERADGITLSSPGSEPRQRLRLSPEVGQRQRIALEIASEVALTLGDQVVPPRPIPTMTAVLDTEVLEAPKDKPITVQFEVTEATRADDPEASARLVAAVDKAITELREAKGTWTLDPQGRTVSVELALPGLDDAGGPQPSVEGFRQALHQLWVRLPAEPVGAGAKWEAVSHFDSGGIAVQQVANYELVKRGDDTIEVKIELEQGTTEPVGDRNLPGAQMNVRGFAAVGRGSSNQRLDRIAPVDGTVSLRSVVASSLRLGNSEPQPLTTSMDFDLRATTR